MRTCQNCGHKTDGWVAKDSLVNKYYLCPKCYDIVYTLHDEVREALKEFEDVLFETFRISQALNWLEKTILKGVKP